jgi:hypothetical protein
MKGLGIYLEGKSNPAVCGRKWFEAGFVCLGIGMSTFLSLRSFWAIRTVVGSKPNPVP